MIVPNLKWTLKREVIDFEGNLLSEMLGEAIYKPLSINCFIYQERVENRFQGKKYSASKEFIYEITDSNLEIFFPDNRLFARFEWSNLFGKASTYICPPDNYQMVFHRFDSRRIEMEISVKGPKKAFAIYTQMDLLTGTVIR